VSRRTAERSRSSSTIAYDQPTSARSGWNVGTSTIATRVWLGAVSAGDESGESTTLRIAQRGALEPDDAVALDGSRVPAAGAERLLVVRLLDHVDDLAVCGHLRAPRRL